MPNPKTISMVNSATSVAVCLFALLGLAAPGVSAQTVALSGLLGAKALLVIDGGAPKSVGVGETYQGVKLVAVQGDQAVVDIAGDRQTLRLGEAPVNAAAFSGDAGNTRIVLHSGDYGHFITQGKINGRSISLMVDTGASFVVLSAAEADRIGLKYKTGQVVQMNTANGVSISYKLKLNSVRVGSVDVYDVDAVVSPNSMSTVLLGNSFLSRFQMTRTNDQMVLEKRY